MNNFEVAKKYLGDIQAVVTEALDNLDRLPPEEVVSMDRAINAVHECAQGYEDHINNLSVESCCYILLNKYLERTPTHTEVTTFKSVMELTLHNNFGVPTEKFETPKTEE